MQSEKLFEKSPNGAQWRDDGDGRGNKGAGLGIGCYRGTRRREGLQE